jgi:K+/H+ antiporter YhaU regulatory subunit KhtT
MIPSSLLERIRYLFDNTLSKGPMGLLFWLALFVSIVIITVSIFVWTMGVSSKSSILEQAYLYMISSFGAADADTDGTWLFRFASLFVMFSGIFVMGTLISILTTTIDGKINQLRRGRSRIIESDHTIILGWSEEILVLIKELVIANDNHPNSCITILADADKIEMEDKIHAVLDAKCKTRIVCRSGNPALILDLDLVSINTAKSIVILESANDTSGLSIMKTILAIVNNPNRRIEPYHIVTAVDNPKIIDSIKLISEDEVEIIYKGEFISKIEAQTLLQAGLSSVITDLLDFEGDEIYFQKQPELNGKSYKEIALSYDTSAVIGFITNKGDVLLNPTPDTKLGTNDQIIAISNDDDTIIMSDKKDSPIAKDVICHDAPKAPKPINILMLGWNQNSLSLIQHLSDSTPTGSKIVVAANCADSKLQVEKFTALTNLTLEHIEINPTERSQLEGLTYNNVDHVAILPCYNVIGNNKPLTLSQLDANTLVTLLNIQHIRQKNDYPLTITSEILDLKNRILVNSADNDDFVVSDHLISLALAQVSENKALGPVFDTLFNPYNSEIYLKPITNYVKIGQPINFLTVVAAGLHQNETVIGYRLNSKNTHLESNTVLNPNKQSVLDFSAKDEIIVLAENSGS